MSDTERNACSPFTAQETDLLISLTTQKADILERKIYDEATNLIQITAWQEITKEFNKSALILRDIKCLQNKYNTIKKSIAEKVETIKGENFEGMCLSPVEMKLMSSLAAIGGDDGESSSEVDNNNITPAFNSSWVEAGEDVKDIDKDTAFDDENQRASQQCQQLEHKDNEEDGTTNRGGQSSSSTFINEEPNFNSNTLETPQDADHSEQRRLALEQSERDNAWTLMFRHQLMEVIKNNNEIKELERMQMEMMLPNRRH